MAPAGLLSCSSFCFKIKILIKNGSRLKIQLNKDGNFDSFYYTFKHFKTDEKVAFIEEMAALRDAHRVSDMCFKVSYASSSFAIFLKTACLFAEVSM